MSDETKPTPLERIDFDSQKLVEVAKRVTQRPITLLDKYPVGIWKQLGIDPEMANRPIGADWSSIIIRSITGSNRIQDVAEYNGVKKTIYNFIMYGGKYLRSPEEIKKYEELVDPVGRVVGAVNDLGLCRLVAVPINQEKIHLTIAICHGYANNPYPNEDRNMPQLGFNKETSQKTIPPVPTRLFCIVTPRELRTLYEIFSMKPGKIVEFLQLICPGLFTTDINTDKVQAVIPVPKKVMVYAFPGINKPKWKKLL